MKPDFNNILIIFIGWLVMVCYNYRQFGNANFKKGISLFGFFIVFLLFCVFDFSGGDFYGYYKIYTKSYLIHRPIHFEDVFSPFIELSGGNYFLFRLIVWGLSLVFTCLTVRRLKLSPPLFTLLMLSMYFANYVGARQSLGFSILYYGVSFIIKPIKSTKYVSYVLFIFWGLVSCIFHKSMPLYLGITLLSLLIKLNKISITTLVILYPVLYASLFVISEYVITNLISKEYSDNGMDYLYSTDRSEVNSNGIIRNVIDWTPIFLLHLVILKDVIKSGYKKIRQNGGLFYKISLCSIYIFLLFLGQPTSKFLAPRFYDASLFPMVFFCSSYLQEKRDKKVVKIIFVFLVLSQVFRFLYTLYKV